MKKKLFFVLLCLTTFFCQKIAAQEQLPTVSTAENPVWYYCKVKGTGTRVDRILMVANNDVYGRFLSSITTATQRNNCLWRFEKSGNAYVIINKQTNKKLSVRTDATKNIDVATVEENPDVTWEINPYNDSFQIKASSGKYIYQADDSSNRNFLIMLSAAGTSANANYTFLPYNDELPEISDTKDIWYYIFSGNPEYKNKCITDINETGSGIVKFEIQDKQENNNYQQWKLIKPINATNDNVHFVNRATNNIIQTRYDFDGYYNVQSTDNAENSNGWQLTFINLDQFQISGKDETEITGYLNASLNQGEAAPIPLKTEFLNSNYSWRFEKAKGGTSIEEIDVPDPFDNIRIYVINKRIVVEGTDDYMLTHISGMRMPKDRELHTGVYLVTIQGKTKSVLVK